MAIYKNGKNGILLKGNRKVTEIYKGTEKLFGYSDAVSGSVVTVSDVHPIQHELKVKISSKNLFDINRVTSDNGNIIVENNSITQIDVTKITNIDFPIHLAAPCTLTLSFKSNKARDFWLRNGKVANGYIKHITTETTVTFKITNWVDGYLRLTCFADNTEGTEPLVLSNIQIEEGATPTEYTQYVADFSGVSVSGYGKNLFNSSRIKNTSNITNNGDGSITIKANAVYSQLSSTNTLQKLCPALKVGETAILTFKTLSTYYKGMYLPTSERMWQSGVTLTITNEDLKSTPVFYGFHASEAAYGTENIISNIQIELGSASTKYEPYIEPQTATANAEGIVESLTSLSPNMTLITDTEGVIIDCEYVQE